MNVTFQRKSFTFFLKSNRSSRRLCTTWCTYSSTKYLQILHEVFQGFLMATILHASTIDLSLPARLKILCSWQEIFHDCLLTLFPNCIFEISSLTNAASDSEVLVRKRCIYNHRQVVKTYLYQQFFMFFLSSLLEKAKSCPKSLVSAFA